MGIWRSVHASSARNKHTRHARRKTFSELLRRTRRGLFLEPLEDRVLMAIGPQIVSIQPNDGDDLLPAGLLPAGVTRNVAPRELTFIFNAGQIIDANTLGGIRVTRAGADQMFGTPDDVAVDPLRSGAAGVQRGFVGIGNFPNEVVLRFADTLPDDLYQIRIVGDPMDNPLRNIAGEAFDNGLMDPMNPDSVVTLDLDLGAQVVGVVPQPISTLGVAGNWLSQARNQIDVYFNANDPLALSTAQNTNFYQLVFTNDTATNADDQVFFPTSVTYNATTGKASLIFASDLHALGAGAGTYRLRVGDADVPANMLSPETPTQFNLGTDTIDVNSSFANATNVLGALGSTSSIINASIDPQAYSLPWPGSDAEPGHREIPKDGEGHAGYGGDTTGGITIVSYNFKPVLGANPQGGNFLNNITENQKQRAREIFELYGYYTGIQFRETTSSGMTVATGDIRAANPGYPPVGGPAGVATGSLAIMNESLSYGISEFGGSWFNIAMHEIGHNLGLGHAYDLPNVTIMGGDGGQNPSGAEPVFPGDTDLVHMQFLHRPDVKDIDLYRFQLDVSGTVALETIAERLASTSQLDSLLTVYQEFDTLRMPSAGGSTSLLDGKTFTINDGVNAPILFEFDRNDTVNETEMHRKVAFSLGQSAASLASAVAAAITAATNLNAEATSVGETVRIKSFGAGVTSYVLPGGSPFSLTQNVRELLARNDDYYSEDSFVSLHLTGGEYYVAVTSTGNAEFDPTIADSGIGGTTQGQYQLRVDFTPDQTTGVSDADGSPTLLDGDADGRPGGAFNFWFRVTDPFNGANSTVFVDKSAPAAGDGSLANPYNNLVDALADPRLNNSGLTDLDILRVVGNQGDPNNPQAGPDGMVGTLDDRLAYEIGFSSLDGTPLADGSTFNVPKGVTVMVDPGAVFKLRNANIDVGSSTQGVDRSQGHLQVLGTPGNDVYFTSFHNESVGLDSLPGTPTIAQRGDWGGLVFRNDLDLAEKDLPAANSRRILEEEGIFYNFVNHAQIDFGGGSVVVNSVSQVFSPLYMIQARPTISYNTITNSANAAMSADPNSFGDTRFENNNAGASFTADYDRVGPDIHGNSLTTFDGLGNVVATNTVNGIFVRIRQQLGQSLDVLTVPARFDDTDIAHVLTENLIIQGTPGGPFGSAARIDARLKIDPGIVLKIDGARIETNFSSQLLAEGTAQHPIIITSLLDDHYGTGGTYDTNGDLNASEPAAGDWGGLFFGPTSTASIDHAVIAYGGGSTRIEGGFDRFNVIEIHQADVRIANSTIHDNDDGQATTSRVNRQGNSAATIFVRGAQPVLVNNVIRDNDAEAIDIDANSLQARRVRDWGRATGTIDVFNQFNDNHGPLVRLNRLGNNGTNGMMIRGATLNTDSIWDDTDIVHVLRNEIYLSNHHHNSGLRLQSSPTASLVVKLLGATAGFTANGEPIEINDRIGGTIHVVGTPGFPVVLTSLNDDTVGAGFDPIGQPQNDTNNNGLSLGAAGQWRSIRLEKYSNDRNSAVVNEAESAYTGGLDRNNVAATGQFLGELAPNEKSGDDNRRLGFEVHGTISHNHTGDVDIYSFNGTAGSEIWLDIDRTTHALDTIVEVLLNDPGNTVIARSNDSTGADTYDLEGFIDNLPLPSGGKNLGRTMVRDAFTLPHGADFDTTNPRDAGMRLILPGAVGSTNTYFIRVRSNPAAGNINNVTGGLTSGAYQLQLRLRELDEVPGSTVRHADLRFGGGGTPIAGSQSGAIEVLGLPAHSPLISESVEFTSDNSTLANAQDLGNLLAADRSTLSVGGRIDAVGDVDLYRFTIDYQLVQAIGGVNSGGKTWSTIFDIDYADGLTRANTNISVFDSQGRLIYIGTDSNVSDDQFDPVATSQTTDLSRGSFGNRDPYIGNVQLPESDNQTYYVAISSDERLPTALNMYFTSGAASPLIRLEPVNSINRIVEDHIGSTGYAEQAQTVPLTPMFSDGTFDTIALNSHAVAFNLSDVTLYVNTPGSSGELYTVDPFTGRRESTVTANAAVINGTGQGFRDIAMRNDGQLFAFSARNSNSPTAGSTSNYIELDTGTGAQTNLGDDGVDVVVGGAIPANHATEYEAWAFGPGLGLPGNANGRSLVAVGNQIRGGTLQNLLYTFNPNTGVVGRARDATSANPSNPRPQSDAAITGLVNPASENVTGLAFIGSTLYGVTDEGRLYTIDPNSAVAVQLSLSGFPGLPTGFTALSAGPPRVDGGAYASTLFAIGNDNRLYAFSTTGTAQNIFAIDPLDPTNPGRTSRVTLGVTGAVGLAFSTLDYNLWHVTNRRGSTSAADDGHGINVSPDINRTLDVAGGTSYYFGIEDPRVTQTISASEFPDWSNYTATNAGIFNTYNLPGGAKGSLTTNAFSLVGYSRDDKPTLYFNYFLDTENVNSAIPNTASMLDSARVFLSNDNGVTWQYMLATNNSTLDPFIDGSLDTELPEFLSSSETASGDSRQRIQELFDDTGVWRQARISLGDFAGMANLRLRFDFTTSADISDDNSPGFYRQVLEGDQYADNRDENRRGGMNNTGEGFYIDDIIIGFAERGEMATGGNANLSTFFTVNVDPPVSDFTEVLTGEYQLEIRRGEEYAIQLDPTKADITLANAFDTNDRHVQDYTLVSSAGNFIGDGESFVISDGVNRVTFEFDNNFSVVETPTRRRVSFSAGQTGIQIAQTIATAVNSAFNAGYLKVTAERVAPTSDRTDLFHAASVTTNAPNLGIVKWNPGFFLNDPDRNLPRDQGMILIEKNSISNSAGYGLVVDASTRDNNGSFAHPGAAHHLRQLNTSRLVPGVTIENNLLFGGALGGILFSGDSVTNPAAVVPFGRILNNTIYGRATPTGTGIAVTQNASPTLLNNILANLALGVSVDGSSGSTVLGGMLYQGNTTNSNVGLGTFEIVLNPGDPLFVSAATGNFYLAPGSRAIDASINSLIDRPALVNVTNSAGIPQSPIVAPTIDLFGNTRIDDPTVPPFSGLGSDVFFDRGALERVNTLTIADLSVTEGNTGTTNVVFAVTLTRTDSNIASVVWHTTDGTAAFGADYNETAGTLTFNPGQTLQLLTVQVVGDLLDENNETFVVNLSGEVNAEIADSQAVGVIIDDDAPPSMSINDITVLEGDVGTTNAVFTATLSAPSGRQITVNYSTANDTATAGSDYNAASGVLTFSPAGLTQKVTVQVRGDATIEPSETFFVNLAGATNATIADNQGKATITDDDTKLSISDVTVTEGDTGTVNALFDVFLSGVSPSPITVVYTAANGTAISGTDYQPTTGTISFSAGQTSRQATVAVIGDLSDEFDETFVVNLSAPSSGFIVDGQGEGTIIDNDPPATITINSVSVAEGDSGTTQAVFTVAIVPVSGKTITVEYATVGATAMQGTDFVSTAGTLTFGVGQSTRQITVQIAGDTLFEANETFVVQLSSPNANGVIAGGGQGIGTILDDEARLQVSDASATEDVDTHVVFNVTAVDPLTGLPKAPAADLVASFATAAGTALSGVDFAPTSGDLTFTASLGETLKSISVAILTDLLDEDDETFTVTLTGDPVEILDGTGIGTILDNDPLPSVSIDDQSLQEGDTGSATMVFTVTLAPVSGRTATVAYATTAGTATSPADYVAASGVLTFAAGETAKQVTVTINGDLVGEINETFNVTLSSPLNAVLGDDVGTGTILDDEPRISIAQLPASILEGDVGAVATNYLVSLSNPSTQPVTVVVQTSPLTASAGVDYQSINTTLSFAAGETTKMIGVNVLGDLLNELDETFNVVLSQPTNALVLVPSVTITIDDNDPLPQLSITSASVTEGDAGTTDVVLNVTLAPVSGRNVTVAFATAAGTATAPADYDALSGTLTFAPLSTQRQITLRVKGDLLSEGDEQFFVNLSMLDGAVSVNPQAVVTIIDDEPKVSISDTLALEGDFGTSLAVFTVTLDKPGLAPISVNYATVAGTALEGADYQATSGTLIFNPNETAKLVTALVTADTLDEHDETFQVQLSGAVNASIVPGGGIATIIDNDPLPQLSVVSNSVVEGDGPAATEFVFTVTLTPVSGREVTVAYSTANGSAQAGVDYTAAQGTLTFAAGLTEQKLTVQVTGDGLAEPDETFFVGLSNVTNAQIAGSPGLGTIVDDEPRLSVSDASVVEGTGGTKNLVFDVTLSKPSSSPVSVNFDTIGNIVPMGTTPATAGTDYMTTGQTLTFGIGVTLQQVTVPVTTDALNEDNEVFLVQLSGTATPIVRGQGLGTIVDDDPLPALSINSLTQYEGDSGTTNAVFNVTLNAPSGRLVAVDYATVAGSATANSDFNATSGQLSFAAGVTSMPITVQIRGDLLNEADETFTVGLSTPVNALLATPSGVGTIRDDEAQVFISDATVTEGNSGQQNAVFAVTLSKPTGDGATIAFSTFGGSAVSNVDFVATSGTLSFAPGETSKQILVAVNGDTSAEGNETFTVNLTIQGNSALIGDIGGMGTILDDDVKPSMTINDVTVTEDNVGGVMAVLTVALSAPSGVTVTVQADTVDGTATAGSGDYQFQSTVLTFTPGQTTQQISVAIGGDQLSELSETLNVVLSNVSNAVLAKSQGVVTIIDNDPQHFLITGADAGGGSHVRVFNGLTGLEPHSFLAYPGFFGGVRVASADVNGDGQPDIITAPGRGGGPHVRVLDGKTLASIHEFLAFETTYTQGLHVAAGDVNGDHRADIIVATEGAAGESLARVRVFDGVSRVLLHDITLDAASGLAGGARVAAGDITGDGRADIILSAGAGQLPRVVVYNGFTGAPVANFLAYAPGATMGIYVASGDFNGDGRTDIITGPGTGGGPHVRVFDGVSAAANAVGVLNEFLAYNPVFTGGVRVGATDYNGDNVADVITAAGPGGGPHVRVLSGPGLTELASFLAYPGFPGGVFVGGSFRTLGAPLTAATTGTPAASAADLTLEQVRPLVNQAISNWAAAGLDQRLLDRLADVEVRIADLPDGYLGMAYSQAIVLDRDAAGLGWFVDSTPMDDQEFEILAAEGLRAHRASAANQGVDLLTAIAHELGHTLGLHDLHDADDSLMFEVLGQGVRRTPSAGEVDALFADDDWTE